MTRQHLGKHKQCVREDKWNEATQHLRHFIQMCDAPLKEKKEK